MRGRRGLRAAAAGALVFVGVACGASDDAGSAVEPAVGDTISVESTQPLEPVLVPTASGEQLDFNSLSGQDVLLWFWAPW